MGTFTSNENPDEMHMKSISSGSTLYVNVKKRSSAKKYNIFFFLITTRESSSSSSSSGFD